MKKQDIYQMLLWKGLPHIRNVQAQSFFRKGRDKSCYYIAELLHNVHASIFFEQYTDHDFWFINNQVRSFVNNCNSQILHSYPEFCDLLLLLMEEVPENQKSQIEWSFSDEQLAAISEFRKKICNSESSFTE